MACARRMAWRDVEGGLLEALVSPPLKAQAAQLDPWPFARMHRSVVVHLRAVSQVVRSDNDTAVIHLRGRKDVLPVSRRYLHLFRAM